jgi:YHS domain-containing protein
VGWDAAVEVIPLHVPRLEKRMRRRDYIVIKKLEVITMAKDPICGMEVKESQTAATREYKGQKFYFCTSSCYDAFKKKSRQIFFRQKGGMVGPLLKQARTSQPGDLRRQSSKMSLKKH